MPRKDSNYSHRSKGGEYRRLHGSDTIPAPHTHPKKVKVLHKALTTYQNSREGKWTRVAASVSRGSLHSQMYRMRNQQQWAWERFGELELEVRFLPYKRTSTGKRGMFVLFARYTSVGEWPQPAVEREVARTLIDNGYVEQEDKSTPEEWERYEKLLAWQQQQDALSQ